MLGCWSGVRAKDRCLFKYTKNLFRFDRRSHILRRSGALLITFLWQKNVITTTATYSVYLSRQKQSKQGQTHPACWLSAESHSSSFHFLSLQQHHRDEEDVQRCLPEKTQHQVGLHVCVCEGCCLRSGWPTCCQWGYRFKLNFVCVLMVWHYFRVIGTASLQGCLDSLKMILDFCTFAAKPQTQHWPIYCLQTTLTFLARPHRSRSRL